MFDASRQSDAKTQNVQEGCRSRSLQHGEMECYSIGNIQIFRRDRRRPVLGACLPGECGQACRAKATGEFENAASGCLVGKLWRRFTVTLDVIHADFGGVDVLIRLYAQFDVNVQRALFELVEHAVY